MASGEGNTTICSCLFGQTLKNTPKAPHCRSFCHGILPVTTLCEGNPLVTGWFSLRKNHFNAMASLCWGNRSHKFQIWSSIWQGEQNVCYEQSEDVIFGRSTFLLAIEKYNTFSCRCMMLINSTRFGFVNTPGVEDTKAPFVIFFVKGVAY